MDILNIATYLFLGIIGIGLIFLAMMVFTYGYLKNEERMMIKLSEMEAEG